MEKYQQYLQEAKKWCDDMLILQEEANDFLLIEEWKRKVEELEERLLNTQNAEEAVLVDGEIHTLHKEWRQFYDRFYAEEVNLFSAEEQQEEKEREDRVPIGGHKLPPLPYPCNALEPYIDEETMRLHHDKHHQSYVDGLNKAEKELAKARRSNDFSLVKHWERELAFNGAGHYLHSIFWKVMCPRGGGKPSGNLEREIIQSFGSFAAFKNQFSKAAEHVEGGGWAILVWVPPTQRLEILQAEKHQNLSQWDVVPLLVLDVWEHAYYLKYKNKRADYIENWWKIVCWEEVSRRLKEARRK
ncbi:superoxide dismutase [Bacillus aerolatus]|uniref:superoxide dismutase n=1 Tax=Bacillus aerolatus TaxID=2653354 RepID=A0A6I1FN37_9BACI|nr:superoxide dismutase [Bacillus aerolatus]KAB7707826.1 superoxide dismutase [Bacillus aerolatus]